MRLNPLLGTNHLVCQQHPFAYCLGWLVFMHHQRRCVRRLSNQYCLFRLLLCHTFQRKCSVHNEMTQTVLYNIWCYVFLRVWMQLTVVFKLILRKNHIITYYLGYCHWGTQGLNSYKLCVFNNLKTKEMLCSEYALWLHLLNFVRTLLIK